MKILLVDDDAGVIQALFAVLKTLPGHESRSANSGEEALAAAAELGGLDLLITDVVMEPMDGFTLRDQLTTKYPQLRTILISGYDLSDYPDQTKHHQLLAKPIEAETLRAAVARELPAEPAPEPVPASALQVAPVVSAAPAAPAPAAVPVAAAVPARPTATAKAIPIAAPTVEAPASGVRPVMVPTVKAAAVPQASAVTPSPVAPKAAAAPAAVPATDAAPVAQPTVRVAATAKAQPVPVANAPKAAAVPASGVRPVSAVAPGAPTPVAKAAAKPVAVPVPTPAPGSAGVATKAVAPTAPPQPAAVPTAAAVPVVPPGSVAPPGAMPVPGAVSSGEDLSGQTFGAYAIHRKIGGGRWGSIYAGLQTSINRPVALEVLDATKAANPVLQPRFVGDARAKAGVQHPSTLAVYEAGEAGGRFFYAYEFVDGRSLADVKAAGDRLDEPVALKVLQVVADGLAYFTIHHTPHSTPEAASIFLGPENQPRLSNLATQLADEQLAPAQEIQAVGRIMLTVLPAVQSLSPGFRDLLKRMVQPGPQGFHSWTQILQAVKALEPKVVPTEAAKISAHDRAAIAAVEQARQQQKRSLVYNIASLITLLVLIGAFAWWFFSTNERTLDEQVEIPAGDFIFGNGEKKNLPVFWIDKYEVTYGQYAKFVEFLEGHPTTEYDHPQQPRSKAALMHKPEHWNIYYLRAKAGKPVHSTPIDLNCPVMEVDFWDAYAYAKWKGRELPTEEEWEKAARGTKGFKYPWGDEMDAKKVNSNADYDGDHPDAKGKVDGYNFWSPVDRVKGDESPFEVIGMAGNVREWTNTWDTVKRKPIVKGGSFSSDSVRLDQRMDVDPSAISEAIGFRTISRTPPVKK